MKPGDKVRHASPDLSDWEGVVTTDTNGQHVDNVQTPIWVDGTRYMESYTYYYVDFHTGTRNDGYASPPGKGWYEDGTVVKA